MLRWLGLEVYRKNGGQDRSYSIFNPTDMKTLFSSFFRQINLTCYICIFRERDRLFFFFLSMNFLIPFLRRNREIFSGKSFQKNIYFCKAPFILWLSNKRERWQGKNSFGNFIYWLFFLFGAASTVKVDLNTTSLFRFHCFLPPEKNSGIFFS